ncbi:MAG: hypothetical protein WC755_09420 [Candidatus Woesearchaeota archaeon]|jgi:hypothetical protein
MRAILEHKFDELPIEISEVKEHFALSDSDSDIAKFLQNAIEHVELQTGLSLQKKVWKIIHDNSYLNLSFGPVLKILSITDGVGNAVEPMHIRRTHDNLILQFLKDGVFKVRYEAGYDKETLPNCLKHTILEKFWDLYSQSLYDDSDGSVQDAYFMQEKKKVDDVKYYFKF